MNVRLVLFGTSPFGLPSFQQLSAAEDFEIVAVVTQPARPVGRKHVLTSTAVATWATSEHIPALTPVSLKGAEVQNELRALRADLFIVASYGLLLPQAVLDIPKHGSVNIHASLLPKYRGASPIASAIADGAATTGITYMMMDAGCDTGPILQQSPLPIPEGVTKPQLEEQLAQLASQHITAVVHGVLNGTLRPKPQPDTGASLSPRLRREDGRADWSDAVALERRIRAYQPWPGVWTTFQGTEVKLLAATTSAEHHEAPAGTIVRYAKSWAIVCTNGLLIPTSVQFSGRSPQPAATIPGSYPEFMGARFV